MNGLMWEPFNMPVHKRTTATLHAMSVTLWTDKITESVTVILLNFHWKVAIKSEHEYTVRVA